MGIERSETFVAVRDVVRADPYNRISVARGQSLRFQWHPMVMHGKTNLIASIHVWTGISVGHF